MKNIELIDVTKEFLAKASPGKGSIEYEEGFNFKYSYEEKMTAFWLLETFGGHIILLKQNGGYMIKNPDYKWNDKFWELKGVSSKNSLDLAIKKALKQIAKKPGGIIVETKNLKCNAATIYGVLKKRIMYTSVRNYYVIVKKEKKLLNIYISK